MNATTHDKAAICNLLRRFIAQRSGIDGRDYAGDRAAFMGDYRPILRDGRDARTMLRFIELRDSITAEMLTEGFRAFSGRLSLTDKGLDYTTGQYFPTEYRKAACAVLAAAIWDWLRDNLPKPTLHHNTETGEMVERYRGRRAGDAIRYAARQELGRGIASRWFN